MAEMLIEAYKTAVEQFNAAIEQANAARGEVNNFKNNTREKKVCLFILFSLFFTFVYFYEELPDNSIIL